MSKYLFSETCAGETYVYYAGKTYNIHDEEFAAQLVKAGKCKAVEDKPVEETSDTATT